MLLRTQSLHGLDAIAENGNEREKIELSICLERKMCCRASAVTCLRMQVVDAIAGKPGVLANQNVMIALCGVTKMFVGELVETARLVATSANHYGPLMPVHVYEAYRVLQSEKKSISRPKKARLFK